MSANKYKAISGGCKLSQAEKADRFMWRLSRSVGIACDEFLQKRWGYKSQGMRGTINASILKVQSENKQL